jgi:ribosomal protein L30/L7E
LDTVKVLGLNKTVTSVTVNGMAYSKFLYNIQDHVRI